MKINTDNLSLISRDVPWDSKVIGGKVVEITELQVLNQHAWNDVEVFQEYLEKQNIAMVSCRLDANQLAESELLESLGFRFIEMVLYPELKNIQHLKVDSQSNASEIVIREASLKDTDLISEIITGNFVNERFYIDPWIANEVTDTRFLNWALSSIQHPAQKLYLLEENKNTIGLFVVENLDDGTAYWHLNAVRPGFQGKGAGRKAWKAMIRFAQQNNCKQVSSCVAVRNTKVMNLYASLGFKFTRPSITFHWLRNAIDTNVLDTN